MAQHTRFIAPPFSSSVAGGNWQVDSPRLSLTGMSGLARAWEQETNHLEAGCTVLSIVCWRIGNARMKESAACTAAVSGYPGSMADPLRLLVIGAHPDDAEYRAGGLAAHYRRLGHDVKFVSVTNGDAGHHAMNASDLACRRRLEAEAAAQVCDIAYEIWDHHDGELQPTIEVRRQVIRLIRQYRPDLVLTHRLNDYHPDHRATAQIVQDAAYMVTVPRICSETPHLARDPAIMYLADEFRKPTAFEPMVAIDIDEVIDLKLAMLHRHTSQMYEWLPYNEGRSDEVPRADAGRLAWLGKWLVERGSRPHHFAVLLGELYGTERARKIEWVEAFEPSEYGRPVDRALCAKLFPFVPGVMGRAH